MATLHANPAERRQADPMVGMIANRLDLLHSDVSDVKDVLKELTIAINRLAIVEERLGNTNAALERAFKVLEAMEKHMKEVDERQALLRSDLDKAVIANKSSNRFVDMGVTGALTALGMLVLKKLGIM